MVCFDERKGESESLMHMEEDAGISIVFIRGKIGGDRAVSRSCCLPFRRHVLGREQDDVGMSDLRILESH